MELLDKLGSVTNHIVSKGTLKYIIVIMTFSLAYVLVHLVTQRGSITPSLMNIKYPQHPPPEIAPSYHDNATAPLLQKGQEQKIIQQINELSNSPGSHWMYHMNYKNLLHSPRPTYLPHYRSPCSEVDSSILCLPSVYLAGMPKCGTSELFSKLALHSDILKTKKETHWWTRRRFTKDEADEYPTIGTYMNTYFKEASEEISKRCYHEGNMCYHGDIIVDASASTLWDYRDWKLLPGNENKIEPVILNAHHIKHLTPDVKIIIILRNPIDRLYSDYLYFAHTKTSVNEFHKKVRISIELFSECLETNSLRQCAYNATVCRKLPVRLHVGLYSIFVNDWLNIFPRDQFHFLSLEEYSKDKSSAMKDIFKFLMLATPPASYFDQIDNLPNKNSRKKKDQRKGEMMPRTREILRKFYLPFNRHLVETLKDEQFAYWS